MRSRQQVYLHHLGGGTDPSQADREVQLLRAVLFRRGRGAADLRLSLYCGAGEEALQCWAALCGLATHMLGPRSLTLAVDEMEALMISGCALALGARPACVRSAGPALLAAAKGCERPARQLPAGSGCSSWRRRV